ncbi:hypothetical protein LINPERPRIM_LOCUS549 [Linum perenne]
MVLRDEEGLIIATRMVWRPGVLQPREAEAIALLEGLQWAQNRSLTCVIFESDSLEVVKAVQRQVVDRSEFGSIIQQCRQVLEAQTFFEVQCVKRVRNQVAHVVARRSCFYASPFECEASLDWMVDLLPSVCLISNH